MGNKHFNKFHAESIGHSQMAHANRVLMKDLVFDYAQQLGLTNCLRCGKPLTRGDFTLDHKTPWRGMDNAKELFFDIENIRFSHFSCNSSAPKRTSKHGYSRYAQGCRCDICTEGHRLRIKNIRMLKASD